MTPFTAIATHDTLDQQFSVDGEWQDSPAGGWTGDLVGKPGTPPLPLGNYTLRTNTGDVLQIKITSTILGRGKRSQPFVGIGAPPTSEDDTI